jgi:putative ABC transport system permease protein
VKYLPLIWGALRRRTARTLLTFLSIATAFFLFGTLQGVNVGFASVMRLLNVQHLIVMSRVSLTNMLPLAHVARIAAVPGVTGVSPMNFVFGSWQRPTNIEVIIGADVPTLMQISGEMTVPPAELATMQRTRNGIIVGQALAQKLGWKIGDQIPIKSLSVKQKDGSATWIFQVVGLYDIPRNPDWAVRIWGNYDFINEARATDKNTAIQIYVGIKDSSKSAQIAQAIDDTFADSSDQTLTQNEKDFISSIMSQIGDISFLVNAIVGAVLFTLLFLTANTMAQSVRERVPELAVLKTIGFTDSGVQWLVLTEALILSVAAALVGLALAALVLPRVISLPAQGIGPMHVPGFVFGAGLGVAVLLALVSGVPPAARARRLHIAAALAGR